MPRRAPQGLGQLPAQRMPAPAMPPVENIRDLPGMTNMPYRGEPVENIRDLPGMVNMPYRGEPVENIRDLPGMANMPYRDVPPVNLPPSIRNRGADLEGLFSEMQQQREMQRQTEAARMQQMIAQLRAQMGMR